VTVAVVYIKKSLFFYILYVYNLQIIWVLVTTVWHVLWVTDGKYCLQIWKVPANILNKHSWTTNKGWFSSLWHGWGAHNSSLHKTSSLWEVTWGLGLGCIIWNRISNGKWIWHFEHKMLGVSIVQMYWEPVESKLEKYKLDLVAVEEVRWDKGGSEPADDYTCTFLYGHGNANHHIKICNWQE